MGLGMGGMGRDGEALTMHSLRPDKHGHVCDMCVQEMVRKAAKMRQEFEFYAQGTVLWFPSMDEPTIGRTAHFSKTAKARPINPPCPPHTAPRRQRHPELPHHAADGLRRRGQGVGELQLQHPHTHLIRRLPGPSMCVLW